MSVISIRTGFGVSQPFNSAWEPTEPSPWRSTTRVREMRRGLGGSRPGSLSACCMVSVKACSIEM